MEGTEQMEMQKLMPSHKHKKKFKSQKKCNLHKISKQAANDAFKIVDKVTDKYIRLGIRVIFTVYSFIGVICFLLLIMYCIDYYAATFVDSYDGYDEIFLYIIIGVCTFGSYIGLYGTFKYGAIDEQIQFLGNQNKHLQESVNTVEKDVDKLGDSINEFQSQIDSIVDSENLNDLEAQISAFQNLENALKHESQSHNAEMMRFLREVQTLFRQFKALQVQVEKAHLLNLFYELEFGGDKEAGLNREEFERFLSRLDQQTASKWKIKTFEEMDLNNDGTIDLNEFQSELDRIYNSLDATPVALTHKAKKKTAKSTKRKLNQWKAWLK